MTLQDLLTTDNTSLHLRCLIAIDRLVGGVSSTKLAAYQVTDLLTKIVSLEDSSQESPSSTSSSSALDTGKAILLISALLRSAAADKDLWEQQDFIHPLLSLCDQHLGDEFYRRLKISDRDQNYLKIRAIDNIIPSLECGISDAISAWNSLQATQNFRQKFMSILGNQHTRMFIGPFLPKAVTQQLDELFVAVLEYLHPDGQPLPDVFDRLEDAIEHFRRSVGEFGTFYSRSILLSVCEKLNSLVHLHLQENPFCKPAELIVERVEKKYPLHVKGTPVLLAFNVKNTGIGRAYDVTLSVKSIHDIELKSSETFLGTIDDGSLIVEFVGTVSGTTESININVEVAWFNFDKSYRTESRSFKLLGQPSNIDWPSLSKTDPYSIEPVSTSDELVGRGDFLNELIAQATNEKVGSSYVTGQKRVGKTSLVKTVASELERLTGRDFHVLYLEAGDFTNPQPGVTIAAFGRAVVAELKHRDRRLENIPDPIFDGALAPLNEFLLKVSRHVSDFRLFLIIDEFDELPIDLYRKGAVGDAFFLSIRALSGKGSVGFVLVGSEKMEWILSCQGANLNKFRGLRIDYFNRERNWTGFKELVGKPVNKWLEYSDDALVALYEITAGNPYFTKQICRSVVHLMVTRRDSHVTATEVLRSKALCLEQIQANSFAHFWEDGIAQSGEKAEELSVTRRKILIAFGEATRRTQPTSLLEILKNCETYGLSPEVSKAELREFVRREVLVERDNCYSCKVPLFEEWLRDFGIKEIITTFIDPESILIRRREEEMAYISPSEIVSAVSNWPAYKGRQVTEDQVRAWLQQFGDNSNQRYAWQVLKNLRFYDRNEIREKLREAHGIVHRDLVWHKDVTKAKRNDIIISYLGSPGKSGATYAKMFADENNIYFENVVECSKIKRLIENGIEATAIVFVDDFIGTGGTAENHLKMFLGEYGQLVEGRGIHVSFVAITGFGRAIDRLRERLPTPASGLAIHVCDVLDEGDQCFSDCSKVFPDQFQRDRARAVISEHGLRAVKKNALGFGGCEALVVFENSCPNNTLPILWARTKHWVPLFERL